MARMASSDWLMTVGANWLSSKTSPDTTTNSAPALGRQRTESGHRVAPGRRVARLRFAREEVTGHAELPVGGVHESHCDPVPSTRCPANGRPGNESLGPPADKSRDLNRQVRPASKPENLINIQVSHPPHEPPNSGR